MISTKELRLGNKVQTSKGQVITVQQILSNSVVYESKMELNQEEMVASNGTGNTRYYAQLSEVVKEMDCTDLEPIALTEDILRHCGFRNFLREMWILRIGNSNFEWEFVNGNLRLRNPAPSLSAMQHVHQLQNFLFIGMNYELEFSGFAAVVL